MNEQEILEGAESRIQQHRTREIAISVRVAGRPVGGAEVQIEQVSHAFLFGANIFGYWEAPEALRQTYLDRFVEMLNFATLPFYWRSYEKQPGITRADEMLQCARWCRQRGIVPKAHPMIFNTSAGVPTWLSTDPAQAAKQAQDHIVRCVREVAAEINVFDVVNEPSEIERFDNPLTAAWKSKGQIQFAREAFQSARGAHPSTTLLVNDYVLDHRYERVLEQLVDDRGQPLYDAVGMQSHMFAGVWPVEWQWKSCEIFSRFGRPLHFTEVTILSGPITSGPKTGRGSGETTPDGEADQAVQAERLYTVLFSHPAVEAITWWSFSDHRPWPGPPGGLLRKDMTPKPAYERLRSLIRDRWWTRACGRSGADGTWRCRAFHGRHRVRVTAPGRQGRTLLIEVNKTGPAEFVVEA